MNNYNMPDFDEASYSQIPAIIQLCGLGFEYISRDEIKKYRLSNSQYILRDIAVKTLIKINPNISEKSIIDAVIELENIKMDAGVIKASEEFYINLLAGVSVSEIVNSKRISPQLKFIDFENIENNVFHITSEFEISELLNRRPDIVLFVNGIPLAVIENKKASVPVEEAINQMVRNQAGSNTPKFFIFPQILIATNGRELKYGTMLTPLEYYSVWKENSKLPETKVSNDIINKVCRDLIRNPYKFNGISENEQSFGIYNLLRPERLLEFIQGYVFYDAGKKKIARYQQYFAIHKTISRIKSAKTPLERNGLIWHTQGSGKSLTMVLLVRELTKIFNNPRIIIVTDRRDLDKQISKTFMSCNIKKNIKRIKSADELLKNIKNKSVDVLTTLIQKFDRVSEKYIDTDENIFILIDEAHRTQGGEAHAWMRQILPNACLIAFTGTPLMKDEKSKKQFGGIIDAYTISEAEEDGAILPLIYQARYINMQVSETMLDEFYKRITDSLTEDQRKDFEKKVRVSKLIDENSSRIEAISMDIRDHYTKYFQGTGLKGQIVMPSKYAAIICKKALDLLGGVQSEVIISENAIEADDDKLAEYKKVVADFMNEQKRLYGNFEIREKNVIDDFRDNKDGVELIIVVDKLLTGFDAPRNTVLYLAKELKDHNLLQAIARVNRLFNGDADKQKKESGIIIDYSKNAQNLKDAMVLFSNYDPDDVENALVSTKEKITELETVYQNLLNIFKGIKSNVDDQISYLVNEANDMQRESFYAGVNRFINVISTCMSLPDFNQHVNVDKLKKYSMEIKRFTELKKTTRLTLGQEIDFSKYRDQLHKILDKYIQANEVEELSKEINLSDVREFNQFVEDQKNGLSDKSKAEAIAAQTTKIISERYKQDTVFYEQFSKRISKLLEELKIAKKEDIASLFIEMKNIQEQVVNYKCSDIPEVIRNKKSIHPFYRSLRKNFNIVDDKVAEIAISIVDIIKKNKCVDWDKNITVQRMVMSEIDDYMYDIVRDEMDISFTADQIKNIVQNCWELAIQNKEII